MKEFELIVLVIIIGLGIIVAANLLTPNKANLVDFHTASVNCRQCLKTNYNVTVTEEVSLAYYSNFISYYPSCKENCTIMNIKVV